MITHIITIIIGILAIIGMASVACAVILFWVVSHGEGRPDDEWHRLEDEEQVEYLRKWREKHEQH